jgi:hypothetical protein
VLYLLEWQVLQGSARALCLFPSATRYLELLYNSRGAECTLRLKREHGVFALRVRCQSRGS